MSGFECKDPFTGQILKEYSYDHIHDLKEVCQRLKHHQKSWKKVKLQKRIKLCRGVLEYFENHKQEIAKSITQHMGRPIQHSINEVNGMLDRGNWLCENAESILESDSIPKSKGFFREIRKEPVGLVFVISAWNYPLLITINGLMTAILCGNTVLLKHAAKTAGIGEIFETAFKEAGGMEFVKNINAYHADCAELIEQNYVGPCDIHWKCERRKGNLFICGKNLYGL